MKKHSVIGIPPNPFKKGGPPSPAYEYKHDGEQPQDTFLAPKGMYLKPSTAKSEEESTGRIKIIKVPKGEAPLEIRQAWVGLVLPCDPYLGCPDNGLERGVLTGKPVGCPTCGRNGFSVPQDQAIAILEQEKPEAARWWKEHGFPQAGQYFGFGEEEAEIVSGVIRQRITEVTDEMMGDPNR